MNWLSMHLLHLIAVTPLILLFCAFWKELLVFALYAAVFLGVIWGLQGLLS